MTLLAVERMKLFTTRSPWWCALVALVTTIGFSALIVGTADDGEFSATVASTQFGYSFGMAVIMVLAALAVTTEYRFGTIRTTFQAVPNRAAALVAKTTVVALAALVIGELSAFGSWGLATLLKPDAPLALDSGADWINVAGVGAVYAFAAVIAVAVGILLRHSAGAIALLLIYALAVEDLIRLIPSVGDDIHQWLPFNVANKFLTGDGASNMGRNVEAGAPVSSAVLGQGWSLAYFAAVAVALLAIAIGTARKRDA
ncbi:ABC transporter permease [Amycolatopsis endophytica]|uniref:ABC-2 type transport system permease protein n=1 Tax=Amycolatopsis endophytica TaxID=860233 RepID=A0A853B180_9PSEU|nr:ABC transporter permease [Amycolatopsis endophytica]NYI88541.1 ABC-2 type transport system permease protein [Amycolatopsis endophytica]